MQRSDWSSGRWRFIWRAGIRAERRYGLELWGDDRMTLDFLLGSKMLTIYRAEKHD